MRLIIKVGKYMLTFLPRERTIGRSEVNIIVFCVPYHFIVSIRNHFYLFLFDVDVKANVEMACVRLYWHLSDRLLRKTKSFIRSGFFFQIVVLHKTSKDLH